MLRTLFKTLFQRRAAQPGAEAIPSGDAAENTAENADDWSRIGASALEEGDGTRAIAAFSHACELAPEDAVHAANLGEAFRRAGRLDEAVDRLRRAVTLAPRLPATHHNLGLALRDRGEIAAAAASLCQAIALDPEGEMPHSTQTRSAHAALLFLLCHDPEADPAAVFTEHCRWGDRYADPAAFSPAKHTRRPGGRIRLGYVSGDFNRHSLSYFIEPLLEHHDRSRFEIFCYRNGGREDEVTAHLRTYPATWREIGTLDDAEAARRIADDAIDLLIDLAGHTARGRLPLFARRPAPVQMSYLGYLNTTGVAAIDYRITDAIADPPGTADACHRERLLRLPGSQWCYRPPPFAPLPGPLPAATAGHVTFGVLHSFTKLNLPLLDLWARLLASLPQARLLMRGVPAGTASETVFSVFTRHGVASERLDIGGRCDFDTYWQSCRHIDIALDAHPYNGATTTCEMLWMGVPVVTLAGSHGAARSGASLLAAVGLTELVADTPERYLAIARALALEIGKLERWRMELRTRMQASALCDEAGFTRGFESALTERLPYPNPA